ncbi:formate dehydrogenase subunit gamma [Campylobacter hyointestinalis]|uniref:formate dehydrogenase subunit gamma n=1 Tax=Campylobacter hyointestinalis TaxID=198 RepID=UPI00072AD939|nr:formate dehydrogenase subunit gamma [Campylobacter hyointestinalis]CUU81415.1 formate dehydrogenase%2C cytochrome B subunit [Campylobacter hyointestinalis subsp. hyointestinalis]
MKKLLLFLVSACVMLGANGANQLEGTNQSMSPIWDDNRLVGIDRYDSYFGSLWTYLQGNDYFSYGVAIAIIAVLVAFSAHYMVVGPKHFDHHSGKVYAFSKYVRLVHLIAAISWVILVPTGVIMMWGDLFGGGFFVRLMKNLHGIATILFAISIVPMFLMWGKRMLLSLYDIKWMMIVGGYLSKIKNPVPAGKFNAGQKAWFWVAMLGGFVMILTGAAMYFLNFNTPVLSSVFGLTQVEVLRLAAIVHNIIGIVCAVFLLVHIYMAVFAIKGAIHSIITGYKEEEEVYILHHYWYQELVKNGLMKPSKFEASYTNLK